MASETHTIVGRAAELETIRGFVESLDREPAALLVTGEAGIGKSIVWREGLRFARDRGRNVLQCRPVESESRCGSRCPLWSTSRIYAS